MKDDAIVAPRKRSARMKAAAEYRSVVVRPPFAAPAPETKRQPGLDLAGRRIHFMGAGGIGVSALMELCASRGAIVSGCDASAGGQVSALRAKNMHVETGHCASHIAGCDELVFTAAVPESHPEVQQALQQGKTVTSRMCMLGKLARGTRAICVTGAHGKTTTTWMIAHLLLAAGRDPGVIVGGVVPSLKGNFRAGQGEEFVAEVDESDNRLQEVIPSIPILTNIDNDHLEHYGSIDAIEEAATRFMASADPYDPKALLVGCGDDPRVRRAMSEAASRCKRPYIAYGFGSHCILRAMNVRSEPMCSRFDVLGPFGFWPDVLLPMPGNHNVLNSLAAISVAWHLGIGEGKIRCGLSSVERVGRRFEIKGVKRGIRVIDDYGHHPAEVEANLRAARNSTDKRLCVIFQPHRYTRTAALMKEFSECFDFADAVILLPVYSAGEVPIPGADHVALADRLWKKHHPCVMAANNRMDAVEMALQWAKNGDTVVTQGAGDVTRASDELVSKL